MGSVSSSEELCPQCKRHELAYESYYRVGEEFGSCFCCGYTYRIDSDGKMTKRVGHGSYHVFRKNGCGQIGSLSNKGNAFNLKKFTRIAKNPCNKHLKIKLIIRHNGKWEERLITNPFTRKKVRWQSKHRLITITSRPWPEDSGFDPNLHLADPDTDVAF